MKDWRAPLWVHLVAIAGFCVIAYKWVKLREESVELKAEIANRTLFENQLDIRGMPPSKVPAHCRELIGTSTICRLNQ